jgi:hypothetical protein
MINPIGPLTAADTLLTENLAWEPLSIPPELTSAFAALLWGSPRCITKPAGQLQFVLNSVQDLGFPAALNFDISFAGAVVVPVSPTNAVAIVRFDVNQIIQKTFSLPGGPSVFIDSVTGNVRLWVVGLRPPVAFAGTNCSGQPREFDVALGWNGPGGTIPPHNPSTDLTVVMSINGQPRTLTLNLSFMYGHSGEPELIRVPRLVYAIWWEILMEHWRPVPPPPPPWEHALQDALLGLASTQLAWATHTRADGRRVQQATLSAVESALKRMRSIVEEKG